MFLIEIMYRTFKSVICVVWFLKLQMNNIIKPENAFESHAITDERQ